MEGGVVMIEKKQFFVIITELEIYSKELNNLLTCQRKYTFLSISSKKSKNSREGRKTFVST